MIWFEKDYVVDGYEIQIEGSLKDCEVKIIVFMQNENADYLSDWKEYVFFEKPFGMWVHQEILAEDVLTKYQGKIKKCEQKLSSMVEKHKTNKSI